MPRFVAVAGIALGLLPAWSASAQTAVLLVADDNSQLAGLELAKVMAEDSSLWLRIHVSGRTRLAVITSEAVVEQAPAADAFFRALDETTRVRVLPPLGAGAECSGPTGLGVVDSAGPETSTLTVFGGFAASSGLELERALFAAGFNAEPASLSRFVQHTPGPYAASLYRAPDAGGTTSTLRLREHGHALELPPVFAGSGPSLPLGFVALARDGLEPEQFASAETSELSVTYLAGLPSTDYAQVRARWLKDNAPRFLCEARTGPVLFRWRVSTGQPLAPLVTRYFRNYLGSADAGCALQVSTAHEQGSRDARDFACQGGDDLARVLLPFGFEEPRATRFFGTASEQGTRFAFASPPEFGPLLNATDLDLTDCPVSGPGLTAPGEPTKPPPAATVPGVVSEDPGALGTPMYQDDGSCNVVVLGSDSEDSCTGDSSTTEATGEDSCSGDANAGDDRESCASDSSPGDSSGSESCSADSESTNEGSGCGKNEYDGDTCSGDTASEAQAQSLRGQRRSKPRPLRLSLLTWLAAALALPLRRILGSR